MHLVATQPNPDRVVQYYTPSPGDASRTDFLVKDLSKGSQLLLWSIRKWVQMRQKGKIDGTIHNAYEMAGIPSAADVLDEFMSLLAHVALRPVLVECPCRDVLSCDELLLLRSLRSLQNDHHDVADKIMARLISGNVRRAFCRSADAYAMTLKRASLSFDKITDLRSAV